MALSTYHSIRKSTQLLPFFAYPGVFAACDLDRGAESSLKILDNESVGGIDKKNALIVIG
jgi:hypothetical protein